VIDYKNYSPAMKASEVVWSEETIDAFIYDPNKVVPGTPMAAVVFVEKAEDRQGIVSYLRRQDKRHDSCL
jgi:cytochrome c